MPRPETPAPDEDLLDPLLRSRWSPLQWQADHIITSREVGSILEAARWSPSAGNSQPWSFIVGLRDDATHRRLLSHLAPSSARWAPAASLLVANLRHRYVEASDLDYSEFSLYDLGQAVANMTIQARALGLQARQFRAFNRDGIASEFAVPVHWEVTTMTAFGRAQGDAEPPAPGRGTTARVRRHRNDLKWGTMND